MQTIQAHLVDNIITIDENSTLIGGAWQGKNEKTGRPCPWDPSSLNFFLEAAKAIPNPFVLDIGANTGIYCLLPTVYPNMRGYAFEPNPECLQLLNHNLELNGLQENFKTLPIALSNQQGTATLKIPSSGTDSGLARIGNPKRYQRWKEVSVQQDTLDHVAQQYNFPKVDLIRIDTEGCELFVLQGAKWLIERDRPSILLEIEDRNTAQFGYTTKDIISLLESWGYEYTTISDSDAFFTPIKTVLAQSSSQNSRPESIKKTSEIMTHWIDVMATIDRRLYFRDQNTISLESLAFLAQETNPTIIIELGTLTGISLRTWLLATEKIPIHAFDLSFNKLKETAQLFPVDFSRVTMHEQDILTADFSSLWNENDRVLFFIDAHDLSNVPIMNHVLSKALPFLPVGSKVVVDDIWHTPERLNSENVGLHFQNTLIREIDELQCFQGYFAPYHAGGSFMGFLEVIPLLEFVNQRQIILQFEENGKHIWFDWDKKEHARSMTKQISKNTNEWGMVDYNPLALQSDKSHTNQILKKASCLYQDDSIEAAFLQLIELTHTEITQETCLALSICSARLGNLKESYDFIRIAQKFNKSNPLIERLHNDLMQRLGLQPIPKCGTPGLTIFALPKPFIGHNGIIQRNAITSWSKLNPRPTIILFGNETGVDIMAEEIGALHVPKIATNELGTALIPNLFSQAAIISNTKTLAYVNSDIILFNDFVQAAAKVESIYDEYLLVGQRIDCCITEPIDFSQHNWQAELLNYSSTTGILHPESGIDYFIHSRGIWNAIPPFAIGRCAWDNWLIKQPTSGGKIVIDGTPFVNAIHQEHAYNHTGGREHAYFGMEAKRNRAMAYIHEKNGYISTVPYILNRDGSITPRPNLPTAYNSPKANLQRIKWLLEQAALLMKNGFIDLAASKYEEAGSTFPLEWIYQLERPGIISR